MIKRELPGKYKNKSGEKSSSILPKIPDKETNITLQRHIETNEDGYEPVGNHLVSSRKGTERKDVQSNKHKYASNDFGTDGITDAAGLKERDLNYVTRSKSAKKEQRARAVQRSKTIYLNLSKGTNDGALAKLIEDSTEKRFRINVLFRGFWKKKKSMKFK